VLALAEGDGVGHKTVSTPQFEVAVGVAVLEGGVDAVGVLLGVAVWVGVVDGDGLVLGDLVGVGLAL
jgi:hypothetical protein